MPFPFAFWNRSEPPALLEIGARVRAPRGIRSHTGYVPAGTEGVVRTVGEIGCRVQFEHQRGLVLARTEEVVKVADAPVAPLREVVPDAPEPDPKKPEAGPNKPAGQAMLDALRPEPRFVYVLMSNSRSIVAVFPVLPTEQAKDAAYTSYLGSLTVIPGIAAPNCWVERWPVNGQFTRNAFVNPPRP